MYLPVHEAVSRRCRLLYPAPPPVLSPVPTNAALMGHHPITTLPNHTPCRSRERLRAQAAGSASLLPTLCHSTDVTKAARGGFFLAWDLTGFIRLVAFAYNQKREGDLIAGIEFELCTQFSFVKSGCRRK